jgi:hypothetical protein
MKNIFIAIAVTFSLFLFSCGSGNEKKQEESMPPPDTSKGVSAMKADTSQRIIVFYSHSENNFRAGE